MASVLATNNEFSFANLHFVFILIWAWWSDCNIPNSKFHSLSLEHCSYILANPYRYYSHQYTLIIDYIQSRAHKKQIEPCALIEPVAEESRGT